MRLIQYFFFYLNLEAFPGFQNLQKVFVRTSTVDNHLRTQSPCILTSKAEISEVKYTTRLIV